MFSNDLEKGFKGMFGPKRISPRILEPAATDAKGPVVINATEDQPMDVDINTRNIQQEIEDVAQEIPTSIRLVVSNTEKIQRARLLCQRAQRIENIVASHTGIKPSTDEDSQDESSKSKPKKHYIPETKRRIVLREWPRDPQGANIRVSSTGKMAPNNLPLWGATVLDFFRTQRIPDCRHLSTITTGSKMLGFCKEQNELFAKDEIAWAEEEPEPMEIPPFDLPSILKDFDEGYDSRANEPASPRLVQRIPMHLLPDKLIVHDPDNTLCVNDSERMSLPVNQDAPPHTYKLCLSTAARNAIAAKRNSLKEGPSDAPGLMFVTDPSALPGGKPLEDGAVPEATFAKFPPLPEEALSTPEAHLYLSADKRLGTGNHSYVYHATWEIPRSWVIEPTICDDCAHIALLEKLKAEMPDMATNPNQPIGWQIEDLLMEAARKHGRKGKLWVETKLKPCESIVALDIDDLDKDTAPNRDQVHHLDDEGIRTRECYEGGTRKILLDNLEWSVPGKYCQHEVKRQTAPTTFKVEVAAKLSIKNDRHLPNEARNYQKFPEHFFQHWSGYNVLPPLHDPTPASALVPQFYGYYEPESPEEDGMYLSPIMLVEICGKSVELEDLDIDERHECAALFFRFHCEGWLHHSVYPRNVLVDHGDIFDWPSLQGPTGVGPKRFRLIDFGRSEYHDDSKFGNKRAIEEMTVQRLFSVANGLYM